MCCILDYIGSLTSPKYAQKYSVAVAEIVSAGKCKWRGGTLQQDCQGWDVQTASGKGMPDARLDLRTRSAPSTTTTKTPQ